MTFKNLLSRVFNHKKWQEERNRAINVTINNSKVFDCTQEVQIYGKRRGNNPTINYNIRCEYNCEEWEDHREKNMGNRVKPVNRTFYGLFSGSVYSYNIKKNIGNTKDSNGNPTNLWANTKHLPSILQDQTKSPSQYNSENLYSSRTEPSSQYSPKDRPTSPAQPASPVYVPDLQTYLATSPADIAVSPASPQDTSTVHNQNLFARVAETSPVLEEVAQEYSPNPVSRHDNSVPEKNGSRKRWYAGIGGLYNAAAGFFRNFGSTSKRVRTGLEKFLPGSSQVKSGRRSHNHLHAYKNGASRYGDPCDASEGYMLGLIKKTERQRKASGAAREAAKIAKEKQI